jgi:hypothetical protein
MNIGKDQQTIHERILCGFVRSAVAAFGQEGRRRNLTPKLPGADDLGCGLCNVRAANEASGGVGASSSAM